MADLSLDEFKRRAAELSAARGGVREAEMTDRNAAALQRMAWSMLSKERKHVVDHAREVEQQAQYEDPRIELENLLYLTGDIDEHSAIHDVPSLVTMRAEELCFKHRGWTFSSVTYQSANKTAKPSATEHRFTVSTIHHLVKDAILVNGSWPYLRPDTVLRVVSRG